MKNSDRYRLVATVLMAVADARAESMQCYALVAMASDVQTIVVRDDVGRFTLVKQGDVIADTDWRVVAIGSDSAALEGVRGRFAVKTGMKVKVGDKFSARVQAISPPSIMVPRAGGIRVTQPAHRKK